MVGVLSSRPTLLITDAYNALTSHPPRKERDKQLMGALAVALRGSLTLIVFAAETVLGTVRGGGSVLLPVDSAGRVLELALCLHQQW